MGPGDFVAILIERPDDAAAAFFAALATGATGINIVELYRPRQIEYVLEHARVKVLVTSTATLATLPRAIESNARVLLVDEVPGAAHEFEPLARRSNDPAQVTYTSGSTGQPKGVVMSHGNLWAGVRIVSGYLGIERIDRIASLLPFSFVYGFSQLAQSLYTGATLVVERSPLAQEIVATLQREAVTVVAGVPPLWAQLLRVQAFREQPLPHLRVVTNAGGRLPVANVMSLRVVQPRARLFLMYGLTEVFRSTFLPPELVDAHPDSIGRAIPESVVYIVAEDGSLCKAGEVGEIVHGGPTVNVGYLHDPETTARVFRPNPFLADGDIGPARVVFTGDLGRRDEDGLLYYVGRRDRMFKTLGYRVSPDEVNEVIHASGEVDESVILTEPDEQRGESIVALVVLRDGGSLAGLRRFCGAELPRYMQPARFETRTELPRTPNGKHDLVALRAELLERRRTPSRP